jgi:hypothetical protein
MATDNYNDALRNPAVDYERADLSARAILLFLIGLLVCAIFIELVLWGMFRFLRNSEGIFAQGRLNPMVSAQKLPAQPSPAGSVMENVAPTPDVMVFPQPRLQTNDARGMDNFLAGEQEILNPEQPFKDQTGAIHISIADAMRLIEQRGLPVRSNAPPPDFTSQTLAGERRALNQQVPMTSPRSQERPAVAPKQH